jgi:hypothetical protein
MKNDNPNKSGETKKDDNSFIFMAILLGILFLGVIVIILKLFLEF